MKAAINTVLLAMLFMAVVGCKTIDPDADLLVVRVEQTQKIALATFDTFLRFDDGRREWMREQAPEAHAFAEWLREPQGVTQIPRGVAILESLQAVKVAYKKARDQTGRDRLIAALAAVEEALYQTQKQLISAGGAK